MERKNKRYIIKLYESSRRDIEYIGTKAANLNARYSNS
jgi:hypothetical protein